MLKFMEIGSIFVVGCDQGRNQGYACPPFIGVASSGVTRGGGNRGIGPGRKLKNSKNPIQRGAKKFF